MKIGNPADKPAPAVLVSTSSAAANANGTAANAGAIPAQADASAKIQLSNTASSLLTGSSTPFDTAKVAGIAKSIDDGTYQVDPGAIADKLISNAQELLSQVQS